MERVVRDLLINGVCASTIWPARVRGRLLHLLGLDAKASVVSPKCFFGGKDVRIGPDTFINREVFFDNLGSIDIGARCDIGQRVQLVTSGHEIRDAGRRAGPPAGKPISIGDGCWVGAGVIILHGVTVGSGCVIAAGAVVTSDCTANGLYAGVPARRVRDLS